MSERAPDPETLERLRMSNPDDENKPRKIGCLTYAVVVLIVLGVLVWFNVFRSGPPLRISKETTYITEPLTPDGRYVDYFAALQQEFHPPEMKTDDNGYRVVFRALGDFSGGTRDFVQLQKRYEELGLDAIHDKPTMTYVDPSEYFSNRYISHPEEFEDIITEEKEKGTQRRIRELLGMIERMKADSDLSEEEKADFIASHEKDIAFHKMPGEEKGKLQDQQEIQEFLDLIEETKTDPDLSEEEKAEYIAEHDAAIAFLEMSVEGRTAKLEADIEKINADPNMSEEDKEQEIRWIQMDIERLNSRFKVGLDDFSFEPHKAWQSLTGSLKLHENAIARQWLEENDAALDLVAEQVKKPIFVAPYFGGGGSFAILGMLLPDVQNMRSFARGWQARALIRLVDGGVDGTIDDIVASYQLGRHIEKKATLVEGLVGLAIEGIAANLPYDIGPDNRANTEQLERLRDEMAKLSPQKGYLHKIDSERYMCLDSMQSVMQGASIGNLSSGSGSTGSAIDSAISLIGIDWNFVFEKVNRVYDEQIAGEYTYSYPSMNPARALTLKSRSDALADIFIGLFLPAVEAANEAYRRTECNMNMRRIVLAMHLYEREHGTLPPTFTVDENGQKLHGWRTFLLPYFGDETLLELYSQIRLDEPWDSEHNRQFHERNLDVYRCPSATKTDGETNYTVIVGDELLFTDDGKGQPFDKCGPIMLLLAERKDGVKPAVCWMRPDAELTLAEAETGINREFPPAGTNPYASRRSASPAPIGSNHTGGCNVGLRDGGITFTSDTIDADVFRDLVRGTATERP